MSLKQFLKDWTLPAAIATGTAVYLLFFLVPQLDAAGDALGPAVDAVFPMTVFLTLYSTFCRIDFRQMRPHRWHAGIFAGWLLLIVLDCWLIFEAEGDPGEKILWESLLTCIIGPAASASPVVTGKLGGNINTMTCFVVMSALASSVMIPLAFPLLEPSAGIGFWTAFSIVLWKVAVVLILPLVLGWLTQHFAKPLCRRIASIPDLSFYLWSVSLCITSGITVRNIVHSSASLSLLLMIALSSLVLCFAQFAVGRAIGRHLGEEVNSGQAMFQKNTALSIWVAYMYLNPVASVGAGCYVLWQNIINSLELWLYRRKQGKAL